MKTSYDNISLFILNEVVGLWGVNSDEGRMLYNLDESAILRYFAVFCGILRYLAVFWWFKVVGIRSCMKFKLSSDLVFDNICSLVAKLCWAIHIVYSNVLSSMLNSN